MEELRSLQDWYKRQCNGDWEHRYGIEICTLDNPGWLVKIDLINTSLDNRRFVAIQEPVGKTEIEKSERWFTCNVKESVWEGAGDETKLTRILAEFLNWASDANQSDSDPGPTATSS